MKRWYRTIAVTLLTAVAGAAALAVATGAVASVATQGVSMEPGFRTGDLAVVRSAEAYRVGDVVAYRSDMLDTVVMHRIVATDGGRFTLQGDNNTWLDPEQPTEDDLIGKLAFRVPQGAVWLGRLTSPISLGLIAFGLLTAGGTAAAHTRRRRTRRRTTMSQHVAQARNQDRWTTGLPRWVTTAAAGTAVVGVLGVALGVAAWTTPTALVDRMSAAESGQTMAFSYTAEVGKSPAYDDNAVTAPDPVFRKLADTVDVEYAYKGDPGSISVLAELSTASGWHSTVPLGSQETFSEAEYTGRVALDLKSLERRAQAAAAAIGIPATQVDVAIIPTVTTSDDKTFAPKLKLALTPLQLTLPGGASSLTVGESAATRDQASAPALSLAGRELPVTTARTLSVVLALGALLSAALVALLARISRPATEAAAIRRRYGQILVDVEPMSTPPGQPTVDVVDFATLAKLAGRYELLVLHWSRSEVETFVLQEQGTTYRYRTGATGAARPSEVTLSAAR